VNYKKDISMSHQFHSAFHAAPGKEGGVLNIGPAAISIDIQNLRVFVAAMDQIEQRRASGEVREGVSHVEPHVIAESDWAQIAYVVERNTHALRYNGVAWESPSDVTVAATAEARFFLEGLTES
jgi:hypothetical protein